MSNLEDEFPEVKIAAPIVDVSTWVTRYRDCGLQAVPAVRPSDDANWKRPVIPWKEFEDELIPAETIARWYGERGEHRDRQNLGLITGRCSGGVFCVDLDVKPGSIANQWWSGLLAVHNNDLEPDTPAQRTGGGGRQILFRAPQGWLPPTFKTPLGVDIRGQGGFMVAPPSMHESGTAYVWEDGREPWSVEIEPAPEWLIEAIEKLKEDHGGSPTGPRERTASANSKNAFGLDIDDREQKLRNMVWAAVVDLYRDAPIPPPQAVQDAEIERLLGQYLQSTKSRLVRPGVSNADLLEAEGRGRSELVRKWRYAMKKWTKEIKAAATHPRAEIVQTESAVKPTVVTLFEKEDIFDPWERYPVPDFPLHVLPKKLAAFVKLTSQSTGGDINAVAMAALTSCSAALSQEFRLKMKRSGTWHVPPRLWTILVGDPSSKKTPIIQSCVAPLRHNEKIEVDRYRKAFARWTADKKDKDNEAGDEPPKPIRYVLNSITTEKLGDILARQNRGALVEQDEVSGWIGAMDKYSGGKGSAAERAFWLMSYSGGPMTVDRLNRGEIFIDNLCVAFLGGIQPNRLGELGDLTSDGLLQRFFPVMMHRGSFPQEVEDEFAQSAYSNMIANLAARAPITVRASTEALEVFEAFQREVFDLERTDGLGEHFCSFIGKLTGMQGSLALTLHMMSSEDAQYDELSVGAAQAATTILTNFVIPHALEFYSSTLDKGDWARIKSLASFIITSDADRFTSADFTRAMREVRGLSVGDLAKVLSPLVAGGWLVEDPRHVPARAWFMVDGVRHALRERRETEAERRHAAFLSLQAIRKKGSLDDRN